MAERTLTSTETADDE